MGLTGADIIWASPDLMEQGAIDGIVLDLVMGDTDDFQATVPPRCGISRGSAIIVDGTGWGGIVDGISSTTTESRRTVSGRTWAGVLASRVIKPPQGAAYLEFDGDAHDVMRSIVVACDLSWLFHVPAAQSGIHVAGRFDRYTDAASGLRKALRRAGARLDCRWDGAGVVLSCAPIATVEVDALLTPIAMRDSRHVNHLVLLGSGELEDRLVLDVYADGQGGVSQEQSLFGADLVEAVHELSGISDPDELLGEGLAKLSEMQASSPVEMSLEGIRSGLEVGDLVHASNDSTSVEATAEVTRVVVKIEGGRVSTTFDCGVSAVAPAQGPAGKDGHDGMGVGIESVLYAISPTEVRPSSGWSPTAPASVPEGSWLWVRTVYTDGTEAVMHSKQGRTGPQGPQGDPGPKGADGTSVIVQSVAKADGVTTVVLQDGSGTNTLSIADGMDGANGTPGAGGYVHVAWATNATGTAGFSTTVSAGKTYLGVYTDQTEADSIDPADYSWSLIKGAKGDAGPQGSPGEPGADGAPGAAGRGVSAIEEQYYLSTSSSAQAGGSWSAAQPAWQEGRWIWTRSKVTWSDSTVTYTAPVLAQAMNGANEAASAAQADVDASRSWYAECATPAATAAKVATITPATDAFSLSPGKTVFVRFAATNTAPVASLTLDVDGTGAKPVRTLYNNGITTLMYANHLAANATYQCVYDGSRWIVSQNINTDTYDRVRHSAAIKAAAAIASERMVCGTDAGYRQLAAGVSFDLSYPLLVAVSSIASGSTGANNYEAYPSINATLTGTVEAGAANKMLYLKGAVSGSDFTVATAPFLTTAVPAAADGRCYIPLGIMSSTSNLYFKPSQGLWGYLDGEFQRLDRAALGIATATSQHFWHADDGAHVTRATQAEWEATHSGPNSLWTSIGMLFRDGLTNLLGILSGATAAERGIAVYDGGGNAEANIVAKFTGDGVQVGRDGTANIRIFDDGIDLTGDSGALAGRIGSGGTGKVMASVVRTGGIYYGQSTTFHFAPLPTGSSPTVYITLESSLDASILPHYGVVVKNHFLPIPGTWHLPQIWTISSAASGDGFDITLACLDDYDPALGYAYRLTVSWQYQGAAPYTYFGTAGEMGAYTFSAGTDNIVTGQGSSAVGCGLIASGTDQVVLGKFNVGSASSRVIIGNGTSGDSRSNVFDIDAEGKTHLKLHGDSMIAGAFASRVSSATTDVGQSTNWAYLDGSAGSANFCRWRFKCGIVCVQAYYESTAGIPAYSARTIGTIPAGYRPDHEVDAGGYLGSQAGAANSVIWVTAAGAVAINCTNGQSYSQFYGSISYPIG